MTLPAATQLFNPKTLDMVALSLCLISWRTPRQVEALLPLYLGRGTVRVALRQLAATGRAEAAGDINQRLYRAKGLG